MDVDAATAAFEYYNGYTAGFPIKIVRSPTSDGQWAVDMLVSRSHLPYFPLLTCDSLRTMTETRV
jgi:hypothetical protein